MTKTNITIRIDSKKKTEFEEACEYLDVTITHVLTQAVRKTIQDCRDKRLKDKEDIRKITETDRLEYLYQAGLREAVILNHLNIASYSKLLRESNLNSVNWLAYQEFMVAQVFKNNGLEYEPYTEKVKKGMAPPYLEPSDYRQYEDDYNAKNGDK